MIARARRALGQLAPALADLERGAAIAADTGRENVLVQLDDRDRDHAGGAGASRGGERRRRAGPGAGHARRQSARVAVGALHAVGGPARRSATSPRRSTTPLPPPSQAPAPDFHAAGQPGWCLGAASAAAGNPERAVAAMLDSFGASLDAVLPADRPAAAADLAAAQLAAGDPEAADRTLRLGEEAAGGRPAASIGIVRSALLLEQSRAPEALAAAVDARAAAGEAPLLAARAQLAEGRALAAAGRRREAVDVLAGAESRLAASGLRAYATRRRASCAGSATASTVRRGRPTPG